MSASGFDQHLVDSGYNPVQVWSVVTGEWTGHGTVERSGSSVRLHKEGPLHWSLLATELQMLELR